MGDWFGDALSGTGRIRFRRAWFQAPSQVSSLALAELRGESSVRSSQPILCVPTELTKFLAELSQCGAQSSVSSLSRNSAQETIFHPLLLLLDKDCILQRLGQHWGVHHQTSSRISSCLMFIQRLTGLVPSDSAILQPPGDPNSAVAVCRFPIWGVQSTLYMYIYI